MCSAEYINVVKVISVFFLKRRGKIIGITTSFTSKILLVITFEENIVSRDFKSGWLMN